MTHEYQRQSLEQLITQQTAAPRSAAVVFNENQTLWQTLGFSKSQVSLWLASLPQSNHLKESTTATYQVTPDVAAHLVSLLQQAGGRMPLAQLLKKLPADITTSEQQIRKLALKHAQLEIKGPLLVLIN
ncbi:MULTISPECIES: hypothetical protein [Klebsiella]|uniref:hypothetical protein n=1 Tax=Klebsiella TaxID=570 RepID=UPI000E351CF5|nr:MULTISPECIES: hypothetical protein [Klebsiella]HBX1657170.1 hypothetical protein [Klebsiella quasipneumoniae subsp. similipneumoniae]EKV3652760.1 hypothetical protein [Klebsiella quasipneumoniae]MBD0756293.1 hypothetical protein [Klebsiella quasipneumoniae]MDK1867336.1 hypothetical protein [Klebsiella sp. K5-307]MDK1940100.1 hypothetical protein [Klebsiella sp. K6-322]